MIDFQKPQTWIIAWCEHNTQAPDNLAEKYSVCDNYQAAWDEYKELLEGHNLHSASLAIVVESTDYESGGENASD